MDGGLLIVTAGACGELYFFFQAEDGIRDGHVTGVQTCALPICAKAVQLAQRANRLSGGSDPIILHTLAAAYAENRQFSEAVNAAQRALELADANGVASLAESLRSKLALYQAETPYRDSK